MTVTSRTRTIYLIRAIETATQNLVDKAVRSEGITATQYIALSFMASRPELSAAQLARRTFVTPQTIQGIITALSKNGFIERSTHPGGGRKLSISVTEKGQSLLQRVEPRIDAIESGILDQLNDDELVFLRALLNRGRISATEMLRSSN